MAYGRTLDETATWAVAIVCLVMVGISILIEHLLHMAEKWFKNNHKDALAEALEKLKAELMLMGCISLLLTAFKDPISRICVPKSVADSWHPCRNVKKKDDPYASIDKCSKDGKFAFVSVYGVDQIHYLIFVLAVVHVFYCIITYLLGRLKMREWMTWEDETKTFEYQYHNDQQRFRFARDTSFGRRHLKLWNKPKIVVWIVCFFRQFFGSVTKVDYLTLRHGFIMAHFAPGSEIKFDFQKYINRSVEEDFTVVVGITPVIWCVACVLMLTSTYGSYEYFWLPFIPLVIILAIGAKLEYIIAQMGIKIQERGDIVQGAPQVQPGDELFWFGSPRLLRFLIHLCLFQNAFQIAFFFFTLWKLPYSCYHKETADVVIKMTMGVVIQIICSYVTLPLYALVTQMGSSMRLSIFQEETAETIKHWHHTAKEHTKHGKHSVSHTPMSSRPGTPTRDMSPVHLLPKNHKSSSAPESVRTSPRNSDADSDNFYTESLKPAPDHQAIEIEQIDTPIEVTEKNVETEQEHGPNTALLAQASGTVSARHEIGPASREFSFRKAMSTLSRSNLK